MDDLILAARLFEKQYAANLEDQGLLGRAKTYGKNVLAGAAGRIAQANPLAPLAEEGQAARYTPEVQARANRIAEPNPTSAQAANIAQIDTSRITDPACATCGQPAQPGMSQCGNCANPQPEAATTPPDPYLESLTAVGATGQPLTPDDTKERTMNTEVKQTLAPDGSVDNTKTTHTTTDKNADGLDDNTGEAINSPDTNQNATTPDTNQNAQNAKVANAQNLANSSFGSVGANIATLGGRALLGGINRWRGNRKLDALANAQPGAGGSQNANMIRRADGMEFLDEHWNLQKARMEARERATTEAIRNAYR